MFTRQQQEVIAGGVRKMQIVVGGLVMGVLSAAVLMLVVVGTRLHTGIDMLVMFALAFSGVCLVVSLVVKRTVVATGVNQIRSESSAGGAREAEIDRLLPRLLQLYATSTIIGCALLEGAAFACVIFVLVTTSIIPMFAAAVMVGLMAWYFPTQGRGDEWLQRRVEEVRAAV